MTDLSQNIKNGQQLNGSAGTLAITSGDVVLIGGPGGEVWSAATADYAAVPSAGTLQAQTSIVAQAMPGSSRQPIARDKLGNLYIAGTKSGGNLVAYKYNPTGALIASAVLDATVTSVNTAQIFQLQNGSFAVVYARAAGALYFVIFDAALTIIAGPVNVDTERAATNVVYHSSCSLTGGGFAIVYQSSAGTALRLATYANSGSVVQAAVTFQTLAGSAAQEFLRVAQLSSGNLVCSYRGAMTAGGIAGTSFTVITVAGVVIAGPTSVDTVATLGFTELNVLPGFFAIADANGTNLVAAVYSNAGAIQGSAFNVGNTLNSITYPQIKLINDGNQFWLVWFSSVANGIYTIALATSGASGASASGLGSATLTASTFALDVEIINGLMAVFAASSGTGGQYWMTIGLPDSSLGIVSPYIRVPPAAFGTAAATTGCNWPRILSGGAGLYQGTSPPPGQPVMSTMLGDFTVILVYDQQNVNATFLGIQKVEATAIVGTALRSVAVNNQGSSVSINPGPGEYVTNNLGGSSGLGFNHLGLNPAGTAGTLFSSGAAFAGMTAGPFTNNATVPPTTQNFSAPGAGIYIPTSTSVKYIWVRYVGAGGAGGSTGTSTGPAGGDGGDSIFNGVHAKGGGGGPGNTTGSPTTVGGIGGTGGAGVAALRIPGASGGFGGNGGITRPSGGGSAWGGGAPSSTDAGPTNGIAATPNTGGGGGGASASGTLEAAASGGGGEYAELILPAANYNFTVGASGIATAGTGSGVTTGGLGGSGLISVREFY